MAETLLLADDNPTMRRVVELTCAQHGFKVVSVSDGQQAVDYLLIHRPALALISVTLQQLDGFEVARIVRDRPELSGFPVVLLAGAFEDIDEARVRESGAAGLLVKPFEPGLLIKRVKELLRISTPEGSAVPGSPSASQSGRLITTAEVDAPPPPSDVSWPQPSSDDAVPPDHGGRQVKIEEWEPSREVFGRRPDAAVAATARGAEDGVGRADAAFDAGTANPAGQSAAARPELAQVPAASRETQNQVLEAEGPFGTQAASRVRREAFSDFGEFAAREPGGTGRHDWHDLQRDASSPSAFGASFEPERAETSRDVATVPAAGGTPAAAPGAAADAFAVLWAHEQGEPLPPLPVPAPLELSEQTIDAVADRLTDRLAVRVIDNLASRITDGLSAPLSERLAPRLTDHLTTRLAEDLAGPVAERASTGLAEQIAARLAERVMENAFGDNLRQTVRDVSERLVREEIARIRAAAKGSQGS
jgi:CheY-like chemotaxis protein